jgi:hypothetical protein
MQQKYINKNKNNELSWKREEKSIPQIIEHPYEEAPIRANINGP